jgi:pimeloyl-ACP methyl ester carboxylesterase
LEDTRNTRFILFNYPGQSHTIYDKNTPLRASEISSIVDKLIYRLSSEPNQLNIISKSDTLKIIGFGFGGYLTASFLSSCPALYSSVSGVTLVNAAFSMTQKYKSTYESLLSLYSVSDPTT